MDVEEIRLYCLQKINVEEGFPFGESTLVFKVKGKIFLLLSLDSIPAQFNVKCDPELAIAYREEFPADVLPGYHMNKKHWNTVLAEGNISPKLLRKMVDHSYELVAGKKK